MDDLVHSSQLDDRLRRGDAVAGPKDKRNRRIMEALMGLGLFLLVAVLVGHVGGQLGIGFDLNVVEQTLVLALALAVLSSCTFLFGRIHWRALRKAKGLAALDKVRTDIMLTMVSIVALFTVAIMVIIEFLALLVFLGIIQEVGQAGAAFARNFVLFQTFMLLVYLLALVIRESNASSYVPGPRAVLAAKILTPVAGLFTLLGVLLAMYIPQSLGVLTGIDQHQGVYIVTLGVLLEFMAMRIRLRLPSLYSRFRDAVEVSRRADEHMRIELKKRALRTYLIAFFFVAASMAFAGAIATGALPGFGTRGTVGMMIFYVGTSLIVLGVLLVRYLQQRHLERGTIAAEDTLQELLSRKRKSPEEVFRMSVYAVTGFAALIAFILAVMVGMGQFSEKGIEEVEVEGDRPGTTAIEEREVELGIHPKFSTDLALLGILLAAGPFGFFYNRELKRVEGMDDKFPDFLRDIAESARAGMTLPRALITAAQGQYGALTGEIRMMAAQVEWGVEFSEALERFAGRARTSLIDRTVSLVVEAQRAGGNVVDILTAASEDAREIKQIVSERNEQMSLYKVVVFIAFFVFIAVVLILSAQFIPAFKEAVGAASGQQVGGIKFKDFEVEDFNTLFFHAAIVQGIGGGLVGGVLTRGNPIAGFGSISIMLLASWFCFRVLIGLL